MDSQFSQFSSHGLTMICNDSPKLSQRRSTETRLATLNGVIVDRFLSRVAELADHMVDAHNTSTGFFTRSSRVELPEGYTEDEKGFAFDMLRDRGFDIMPTTLYTPTTAVWMSESPDYQNRVRH